MFASTHVHYVMCKLCLWFVVLQTIGQMFVTVGMCEQAVVAYVKVW